DLLARAHALALGHPAAAVVAVGGEPLLVVLDDDELAVADQARTRIHHHAVAGGAHRCAGAAGQADALPGRVALDVPADELPVRGPAPGHGTGGRRGPGGLRRRAGGLHRAAAAVGHRARTARGRT